MLCLGKRSWFVFRIELSCGWTRVECENILGFPGMDRKLELTCPHDWKLEKETSCVEEDVQELYAQTTSINMQTLLRYFYCLSFLLFIQNLFFMSHQHWFRHGRCVLMCFCGYVFFFFFFTSNAGTDPFMTGLHSHTVCLVIVSQPKLPQLGFTQQHLVVW